MGDKSDPSPPDVLESQVAALKSSSTNLRTEVLRKLLHEIQGSDDQPISHEALKLLPVLLATYPRYADRKSRRAVQSCLRAFLRIPTSAESTYPTITKFLLQESQKPVIASTNSFVLLEWCCIAQQESPYNEKSFEPCFGKICLAAARFLDKCEDGTVRGGVQHSAVTIARRGLRDVFKTAQFGSKALELALKDVALSSDADASYAPYVGIIAGVSSRIPERQEQLQTSRKHVLDFYVKSIIGAKITVPAHQALGLEDFFSDYVTASDVGETVVPAIEKAILRSPETILQGPIEALASCLPEKLDISELVSSKLVKPLLSAMNSTNATIREGAGRALLALVQRGGDADALHKTAGELASALKSSKAASFEMRGIIADVVAIMTPGIQISTVLAQAIIAAGTKEANEGALRKELAAVAPHLRAILSSSAIDKSLSDSILKGCSDKRLNFRKLWILCLASVLKELQSTPSETSSRDFVRSALKVLKDVHDEIAPSPLPATQNGYVGAAFGLPALLDAPVLNTEEYGSKVYLQLRGQLLTSQPKLSFLLNSKVYTRLSSTEDNHWALYALVAVAPELESAPQEAKTSWAKAILHLMLTPEVDSNVRKETGAALSRVYMNKPASVGQSIVLGIWDVLRSRALELNSNPANAVPLTDNRMLQAIKCISPTKDKLTDKNFPHDTLEKQSVSTIVLLRPELIAKADWIATCLATEVDPGQLAEKHRDALFAEILSHFESDKFAPLNVFEAAACNAAATLAFVAPDTFTPALIHQFRKDLDTTQLEGTGPTEALIARSPEGTLVVDVLGQQSNGVLDQKNQKDYDVLKWEEEIRSQLAKKKGAPQKKLTSDQQAKVDAQLAHEKAVRSKLRSTSCLIRRGAKFVEGLARGPPTDARLWMSSAITALISALEAGAALIVDEELVSAYLACSVKVSDRLGTLRPFIGVATLRSLRSANVPEPLCVEPLADLGTRVLYRLRFAAEQRPFDTASTAYALPLIFQVLENGRVGELTGDDADAQVLLALEFLSFQMGSGADEQLPRADILRHLVSAMQKYTQHYRVIKDCLFDFCRAISENLTEEERDILLSSVTLPESSVRSAVLQAIQSEIDLSEIDSSVHVWVACQDEEDENADTALAIWQEHDFSVTDDLIDQIPPFLCSTARSTRLAASKALAQALLQTPSKTDSIMAGLEESYRTDAQPLVPKRDKFGIVQRGDLIDQWEKRSGIALAFKELGTVLSQDAIIPFMNFLVSEGPLSDRNSVVRSEMVDAGTALVAARGKDCLEPLMEIFERVLQAPDKATQEADWIHEAVIVLYGSLAQHLPDGDTRTQNVIQKLLDTLSTPSESVQYAVANCLPPLLRPETVDAAPYISSMLDQLFNSKKYAARRGAAYGLAGIVKGKGVAALRQHRVISTLRNATENKKSPEQRQGAMMAFELLSLLLGRTFEPYVIEVLPQLLTCFGDPVASVREATLDTAKTCFASLSSFGVRRVLPPLLEGLDETQWRSKKGACDLLGAMAYLDPQQLATSLPEIIPPLTAVLTDSHKEVRAAANSSLKRFGEVITNPEVKSLVDVLLKALSDPNKYTEEALDGLIKVSFIHYIDSPSLALVVRILERGLNDRSATKRKAAQIIGSLAHLTEKRDIITHLPVLVTGLRLASVDPVPATRATGSKALGSLVEKLGEDSFPDLIPSLMSSLRTDTGASDRLGSAQALSEVLAGLGTARLEETLPTILQNVASTRATVREGFMTLFIFLPACFGNSFANYLAQIIPSILAGLADEVEAIRETSLRAGRLLVKNFASKSIDLLLPELQRGLADDSYRIRLSSVELVGDLLFNLTGITGTTDAEEEGEKATQAGQSLLEVLGEERRNRVLSSLYICRCDTSGQVRAAAIAVWKALVATPRTLRELVPTLSQMIIARLASSNMEHKVIAANALGEVIRKAGEGVFASLLPSLEEGLQTATDSDKRQGICIALREIVNAAAPESLEEHEKKLIAIVRLALTDSDPEVREAAAESFDSLQQTFGKRAVDQVLPHLLNLLRSEGEAENALSALLTLLTETTRANVILPNLIPTLLTNPITAFNARALASLAKVGSASMTRRLPAILNNLADNIVNCKDEELLGELNDAFDAVLSSVDEYDGLNTAISVMLAMIKHDDHRRRAVAANHLASFFATPTVDYSRYNQDLIRVLLISFGDRDQSVVKAAWSALSQLQSHLRKEEMETLVGSTRQVLQQAGTAGSILPGFALPKGILPVLQIFLQGLMNGTTDQRVQSAMGISDIIDRSSPDSLKPFVTQITGPLIRVVGERSMDVKCAILSTLNQLLEKIPTFLRPFLPQLQRTFTKSIADPTSNLLRTRATKALSTLITLTPRVDPLIAELVTGAKTPEVGVRNAMLKALQEVVSKVGSNMSDTSRESILGLMDTQLEGQDDNMMVTNARLLGAMIKVLPAEKAASLIKSRVLVQPSTSSSILALNAVLLESAATLLSSYAEETRAVLVAGLTGKNIFVQQNAVLASGKYLLSKSTASDEEACQPLIEALASVITPGGDIDSRRLALVVVRTVARHHSDETRTFLSLLVPPVFSCVRDPVIPVKLAAEAAFLELFGVVDEESAVWDKYMAGPGKALSPGQARPKSDYFKRVALRLGAQARERREAEGGAGGLGLSSDEQEDEREVWSVGRVDLSEGEVEED
ncbi:translational activator of GCN4 [Exophiala xenobiotica]|nr:translational activator of GCN4 [Exophiala xenobiotica]KAK5396928.1 translational activator of GCN4 [Exophiala xenobiotica]KAK5410663.1 translational activator of GCN4 [Exophiala xenobiotica]KAK5470807.1 translational activator of GCN4 [Exophiala xenobiotica]KAK5478512.1 translational activator of GCN4 [Exophiala xenobiotica]